MINITVIGYVVNPIFFVHVRRSKYMIYATEKRVRGNLVTLRSDTHINDPDTLMKFVIDQIQFGIGIIDMTNNINKKVEGFGIKTTEVSHNGSNWLINLSYKES